jgi:hypothetical protein
MIKGLPSPPFSVSSRIAAGVGTSRLLATVAVSVCVDK